MKRNMQKKLVGKFGRGVVGLFTFKLLFLSLLVFLNSCQEEDLEIIKENELRDKFVKSLGITQDRLAEVDVFTKTRGERKLNYGIEVEEQVIYLDFLSSGGESAYELTEINSLVGIAQAVDSYKATISYKETESGISFNVPIETVINSLSPSLNEAKNYLYTKGFNDSEIDQMIVENGGQELDLIPFVMSLVTIEQESLSWQPSSLFFVNQAYAGDVTWEDYARCAMIGIGADVLWALGTSNVSSWSKKALSKAFGAVAKRFLGPIGVGIAVVSFGVCIGEAYLS